MEPWELMGLIGPLPSPCLLPCQVLPGSSLPGYWVPIGPWDLAVGLPGSLPGSLRNPQFESRSLNCKSGHAWNSQDGPS